MSYLNTLRLHFQGQFQCNVSTVNNDPGHYDNAIFQPSYQSMQGPQMNPPNGWFNPQGDAAFRLLGCEVTAAWTPGGAVAPSDPVNGCIIADADDRVPAKMVDLDPEQQLVSEIWGLQVRIADHAGNTLMRGQFEPAAFLDIWDRATGGAGGDTIAGAMYQSVLTDLVWGDVSASPFLVKLQSASAASGMLSIKINVDGMNLDFTDPNFMCGRIAGTIGPALAGEPHHLVIGRQFMAAAGPNGNFFAPLGGINFFAAVVDKGASCVLLDLGNALSTSIPGGPINDIGDLQLQAYSPLATPGNPAGTMTLLGTIPAHGPNGYVGNANWYNETAGIVSLPLTTDQITLVAISSLTLAGNTTNAIAEWPNAAFVRAARFVYRMSPGDGVAVPVYAMQYGRPLAGASIAFGFDPSQLQGQAQPSPIFVTNPPPVAVPVSALQYNATATTDENGIALLVVNGTDPGSPRWFDNGSDYGIDGQVYGIRPAFADSAMNAGPVNQWNFVSFLLWSSFKPGNPVTWTDLQPVLQQYANLYPVMIRFLNLADYAQVKANAGLLSLAFGLEMSDPNSMPVTRDLSPAKRQAILAWLQNPLPGTVAPLLARAAPAPLAPTGPVPKGGKAAAAARRLILQQH